MAVGLLTDYSAALSQRFENQIAYQMNREQVLLSMLPKRKGAGKNCAWDAEFSGATAANQADGADVAGGDIANDATVPAILTWGQYRSAGGISGMLQAAAGSSDSPSELVDIFGQKVFGNVSKLGSVLNAALYTGPGTGTTMAGLITGLALAATGTYAGIARGSFAEWAATLQANGGTPRSLTFGLIESMLTAIFNASGVAPDLIVTTPTLWQAFGALFGSNRRWPYRDTVTTAAGELKLGAGYNALEFAGIPIVRDKDCPAGHMLFLHTPSVWVEFLETRPGQDNTGPNGTFMLTDEKSKSSMLPARIEMLGKKGDSTQWFVKSYCTVKVKSPSDCGDLADLQP